VEEAAVSELIDGGDARAGAYAAAAARHQLAEAYSAGLRAHRAGAGEAALARAYELGRKAAMQGWSLLDLAVLHHEALAQLLSGGAPAAASASAAPADGTIADPARTAALALAAQFFTECLSPFEMALRADEALRRANEAAEAANHELESFSYSVAHDLRSPLRSIDGFSLALLEDYGDRLDAEGAQYLRFVRESTLRMGQLIDDLLALSRVARGELQRTRVDVSALATSVVARLAAREPQRRVELVVPAGLCAMADPRLLEVALENLLGNAWKFTGRREHARIEVGADPAARPPSYFVSDNGAGFDMAFAAKLFGAFQRLHSTSEFEGTGIGLAIVRRIVHRHGGRIWAAAAVDHGATFTFTLEPGDPSEP
jgi:light-regulated signal transduction histidine kinase (bacteriophytochrome)